MNLVEKLDKIIAFSNKYNSLKKAAKRISKNVDDYEFNSHFISGHNDELDTVFNNSIISISTICEIGLAALNIGLKNLHPITTRQIAKKEKLVATFEDISDKYSKLNPSYEIE